MSFRLASAACLLLALAACANPDRRQAREELATLRVMAHAEDLASRLREAAVHGDVEGARAEAAGLRARLPIAGLPSGLEPRQGALVSALDAVGQASDPAGAARAAGEVAAACGGCHAEAGVLIPRISAPPAPEGDGVRSEMERHALALDLAWTGVITGSQRHLAAGARRFEEGFLSPVSQPLSPEAQALDDRVTAQARALRDAPGVRARGEHLGELMAACAVCHTARPGGIGIEPQ